MRNDVDPYQPRFDASTRRVELFVIVFVPTKLDVDPYQHQRYQSKKDAKSTHNHCIYKPNVESIGVAQASSALVLQCKA